MPRPPPHPHTHTRSHAYTPRCTNAAMARVFALKVGVLPDQVLVTLLNDRLVAKGAMLDFATDLFADFLATEPLEELVQLVCGGGHVRREANSSVLVGRRLDWSGCWTRILNMTPNAPHIHLTRHTGAQGAPGGAPAGRVPAQQAHGEGLRGAFPRGGARGARRLPAPQER